MYLPEKQIGMILVVFIVRATTCSKIRRFLCNRLLFSGEVYDMTASGRWQSCDRSLSLNRRKTQRKEHSFGKLYDKETARRAAVEAKITYLVGVGSGEKKT